MSFVVDCRRGIYTEAECVYQRTSGEQMKLDFLRMGKAKASYDYDVVFYRKRPRLDRLVVKLRKNSAGVVVGGFGADCNMDMKDTFFEHAFGVIKIATATCS